MLLLLLRVDIVDAVACDVDDLAVDADIIANNAVGTVDAVACDADVITVDADVMLMLLIRML